VVGEAESGNGSCMPLQRDTTIRGIEPREIGGTKNNDNRAINMKQGTEIVGRRGEKGHTDRPVDCP